MKISWLKPFVLLCFVATAILNSGCASSNIVKKSDKELALMEVSAHKANAHFNAGEYDEAEEILKELSKEHTVSQPLYQCELGTVYLAKGEEDKAFKQFSSAQVSAESFFDEKSEKKATSLWGAEGQKVYKGEAYERSSLYLVLGMLMFQRNEIDNALACFKSGLLSDADVEEERYKSDYALLHFLAAKCCELRDEPESQKKYMNMALKSFAECHPDAKVAVTAMYDLQDLPDEQDVSLIVGKLHTRYGEEAEGLLEKEEIKSFLQKKIDEYNIDEYYKNLMSPFNTLVVIWSGTAPDFKRTGRYGEARIIRPGDLPIAGYSLFDGTNCIDCIRGFASLGHQATTRGGRMMDNVLGSQANFKGFTDDLGSALIDNADDIGGYVGLGMLVAGLVVEGVSAATTVEADIRAWRNLPHEFQVVPMQLAAGEYDMKLCAYKYATPLCVKPVKFTVKGDQPVNVVHVFAHGFGKDIIAKRLGMNIMDRVVVALMAKSGYKAVDKNGDAELSAREISEARNAAMLRFDLNKNGEIDVNEFQSASSWSKNEFNKGMEK